ncbi:MAG: hypothetical protein ABIV43_03470 [Candidatus Saccharimonadales bacterium]
MSRTKKFLVITSQRSTDIQWADREAAVKAFYGDLEDKLGDVAVLYTTYDEIECTVRNGAVTMFDNKHQLDLKTVDLVHFKNWMFDSEQAATIACYLEHHTVSFFNSEVNIQLAWGKVSQMVRLAFAKIEVPDTYFAKNRQMHRQFSTGLLPAGFSFPAILKADDGAKGNDNHLVRDVAAALAVLDERQDKHYVLQNFLPNDGDYRFLFMGLDEAPLVFLRLAAGDSHLNNTSQGGSGELVDISTLPKSYLGIARSAASALGREIGGVDILVDSRTQKPYVLEVNSTPALATGYNIGRKNELFANFLREQLESKEEE